MICAITPEQAFEQKTNSIPEFVVDAFNELLSAKISLQKTATIKQDEVIDAILVKNPEINRAAIFANKWLDIEPIFRKAGWKVYYDKPSIGDNFDAYFKFSLP